MTDVVDRAPSLASATPANLRLTLANAVSALRLALVPASVYAVFAGRWMLAAAIFVAAVASDFLDGFLARRRGTVSALGGVLDHTADATYVAVTLWAITYMEVQVCIDTEARVCIDVVPGILPLFIALAFLQYLLDSRALAGGPLRTSWLGRCNGIAYFALVGTVVFRNALELHWLPGEAIYWAGLVILLSTLVSMLTRLAHMRRTSGRQGTPPRVT